MVVAYLTEEYRQAAIHNTFVSDVCLEVGCHAGTTTNCLSKRCRWVLGVDISPPAVDAARKRQVGIHQAETLLEELVGF